MDIRKLTNEELADCLTMVQSTLDEMEDVYTQSYNFFIKPYPKFNAQDVLPSPLVDLYIATLLLPSYKNNNKRENIDVDILSPLQFLSLCSQLFLPQEDNRFNRFRAKRILRILNNFPSYSHFYYL